MLRNALFSLLILLMGKCYAQESFFVLIQADNSQPFYVKMGDKSLNSSAKGRLILSQMSSGSQTIAIGFPKHLFPEQQYTFNIDQRDLEFQLKDLGEKGWGLFNPQTQELKTADKASSTSARSEGIKKDDAFSRLMAGVVGDTAVMYNTYAMEEALKDSPVVRSAPSRDSAGTVVKTDPNVAIGGQTTASHMDTAAAATPLPVTHPPATSTTAAVTPVPATHSPVTPPATARTSGKARPPLSTTAYAAGAIDKLSERKTPKGLRIAFADRPVGKKADTVIIIIPLDTAVTSEVASSDPTRAPASAAEPLFRPRPDPTGKPDSAGMSDSAGSARPDNAVIASTEKVVRDNPDTIHVYVSAAKKTPRTRPDSSHTPTSQGTVDPKAAVDKRDTSPASQGTADRKAAQNKSDTPSTSQGVVDPKAAVDKRDTSPISQGTADRKAARNKSDTPPTSQGVVDPKAAVDKRDTSPISQGIADRKAARNKPDVSPNPPAASPSRELYRKPDSSSQKSTSTKLVVINSDCRNFASDYDVDKLRVKMLDADKDDDKIQTARKIFKTKCFTTKQIRALSEVFASDAAKYRFFEAAYPFVSDDHFRELTDLLADPVYNGKFRAMTGQQ